MIISRKSLAIALVGAVSAVLSTARVGEAIVTVNNPETYRVAPGNFSGVVAINSSNSQFCTGSLLTGGLYILTAAHCLWDYGNKTFKTSLINNTSASFNLSAGFVTTPIEDFFLPSAWNGDAASNNDIAILRLGEPAPTTAQQYGIYRNNDEVGQVFTKVGYGYTGTGDTGGIVGSNRSVNYPYFGQNRYDVLGDSIAGVIAGSQLLFDFDNGLPQNDTFGVHYGINDLGLGINEVNTARGDSGGPGFIGNLIASITSYGLTDNGVLPGGQRTDIDFITNSTFGEFSGETRVSFYSRFIDDTLAGRTRSVRDIPEPSSVLGMIAFGALGIGSVLKRQQQQKG
ncbi:MAG: PEP-CTERM sorting domain-containing protein [Nostocaceae cyanobacterium]|nr:PEP-CTERM sorting domain-containing protein [Nostocaceae cyanobacterium]